MAGVVPADDAERRSRYDQLFRSHYRAVENFVMSRYPTLDRSTVLSNTFEVAWRRLDRIPENAARGWLIGVARNCARNESRSGRRRQRRLEQLILAERPNEDGQAPITAETIDALRAAFELLTPNDREVLLLADWDGLTGADLGAAVGTSGATATVRLHRARTRLRKLLTDMGVVPS
jgi:RNA polymerase sigma factor (sigma-70 family)